MARRKDRTEYGKDEFAFIRDTTHAGRECNPAYVREINQRFHHGLPVRTLDGIRAFRQKKGWKLGGKPEAVPEEVREQEVKRQETADGVDVVCIGRQIRTLDEAIAFVKLDLRKYEVHQPEATSWTVVARNADGQLATVQNHRIAFKARLKTGPNVQEQVEALIAGAFRKRKPPHLALKPAKSRDPKLLQAIVIADPHVGKYAWNHETGHGDYDIAIATKLLRDASAELLEWGDRERVGKLAIYCLGDLAHYDTPLGQTTGGTALDRDGRQEKMLEELMATLNDIIEGAAQRGPVEVALVPGNHDFSTTIFLRLILSAYFRNHKRVTIDEQGTARKYFTHGKCLLGLTHGDKAVKNLDRLMSDERREAWGGALCREIHHGHKHSEALVTTVGGVTIHQHPALCPPDGWHALEGYVGAPRAMDSYIYHADGYRVGTRRSTVRVG